MPINCLNDNTTLASNSKKLKKFIYDDMKLYIY